MAKLDPKTLRDTPEANTDLPVERLSADAAYYMDIIEGLLRTRHYDWARATLEGIYKTIRDTGKLTPNQRQAVDRTMAGRLKHDIGDDGGLR